MKIKLNYTNKSLAIALLMTTQLATAPAAFCMNVQNEISDSEHICNVKLNAYLAGSNILVDLLSIEAKEIIVQHIENRFSTYIDFLKLSPGNKNKQIMQVYKKLTIEETDAPNESACSGAITTMTRIAYFMRTIIKGNGKMNTALEPLFAQKVISSRDHSLTFELIGYPVKSNNADIVGDQIDPDLGDFLSLLTLHYIAYQIQQIDPTINVKVIIASDAEALRFLDETYSGFGKKIDRYSENLGLLVSLFPNMQYEARPFSVEEIEQYILDNPRLNAVTADENQTLQEAIKRRNDDILNMEIANIAARRTTAAAEIIRSKVPESSAIITCRNQTQKNKKLTIFGFKTPATSCHSVCTVDAVYNSGLSRYRKKDGSVIGVKEEVSIGLPFLLTYFKI